MEDLNKLFDQGIAKGIPFGALALILKVRGNATSAQIKEYAQVWEKRTGRKALFSNAL